jgi:predicted enzyme related to lactoylglutathione lyase
MPDPFDALRLDASPAPSDPAFTARLRQQVAQALGLEEQAASERVRQGDVTYVSLWIPDVARAAEFFGNLFDWQYLDEPAESAQGRQIAGGALPHGLWGGQARSTLYLAFAVDDIDAAIERVRQAGGVAAVPDDRPYGRLAECVDDQDMPFALHELPVGDRPARGEPNGLAPGDVSYITLEVRDATRTRAFFSSVLGWQFTPGRVADGWQVEHVVPMAGLHGGHPESTIVPMYRVADLDAAVARVRAAGGSATDPTAEPYGRMSACVDDQGTRFYLGQH